jgi:hypothetical protein
LVNRTGFGWTLKGVYERVCLLGRSFHGRNQSAEQWARPRAWRWGWRWSKRMDGKVVRRERLHERSSAVDGRERERKGGRVEEVWVRRRVCVGAAVGGGWQWVEDGRPGRQHDILPLLTSKSRDSK